MRVPGGLDEQARDGRRGEIGRHDHGRSAKERERVLTHAFVPHRQEIREPSGRRRFDERERVGPVRRRRPGAMGGPRDRRA